MSNVSKTKIVQIIADSHLGGGSKHVLGLLKNLDKEKFSILLITPRGWLTSEAEKIEGVEVKNIKFRSKFDLSSFSKLKVEIAKFRVKEFPFSPIILHAHGPRAGLFVTFAKWHGEKFIYTEHLWNHEFRLKNIFGNFLQKRFLAFVCHRADEIIAVSKSVEKFLTGELKIKKEKIRVIPNAVNFDEKDGEKNHQSKTGEVVIGTTGALVSQKGQIYLIRAFSRVFESLPKARLEIIGDGPEKSRLQKEISNLGLEAKIHLLGEQKELSKFYQNWDLFVLPSLSETFGLVILEAMNYEVPVLATSVGGIPEIVKNEKTGVLVPPANSEKLAKAILKLLVEKKNSHEMTKNAKKFLKENYDFGVIIKEIENVYSALSL